MPDTLASSSPSRPRTITRGSDGALSITNRIGDFALGNKIHVELQNPANADAIYTVPAGKTFTGTVVLNQTIAGGGFGVNAATGGSQASMTGIGVDIVDVVIAGGAGNALTAVVAGGAKGSVVVDGWVK